MIDNIANLPEEISVYKSAQKVDDSRLAFHSEFSLFSNFHKSIHLEPSNLSLCQAIYSIPKGADGR